MDDFMDYVGYKIFIGEGKDVGWPTDYYDEDEDEDEELEELETEEQETKTYDNNYSGKNSREF